MDAPASRGAGQETGRVQQTELCHRLGRTHDGNPKGREGLNTACPNPAVHALHSRDVLAAGLAALPEGRDTADAQRAQRMLDSLAQGDPLGPDRKSTRLNSSHVSIS